MLALAQAEFPTAPVSFQIQIGWLGLLFLVSMLVWVWARSESLRRALFAREDPRLFALFRIGLGLFTFQNFLNLRPHWRMLWTDEGLFTAEQAQTRLGPSALSGWSEGEGFFDGWALLKFFWGKHSLLFIDSDPAFVQVYLVILLAVLLLFTVGFRTRVTAVLGLLLINGLYNRNELYHEGHDVVFRCVWFVVLFARTDAAWSVDNWLRRWRERRLGRAIGDGTQAAAVPYDWGQLLDRAGHWLWAGLWALLFCIKVDFDLWPVCLVVGLGLSVCVVLGSIERARRRAQIDRGRLEPVEHARFLLIPAWPRYLLIAQLICIYWATGLYKTGPLWADGEALYYALNMDHFYRFEGLTQWVSLHLATNVFWFMTMVTLWWEKLFVLVALGLILRWRHMQRDAPWYRAMEAVSWRMWLGRAALIFAYVVAYRTIILVYPWCLELQKNNAPAPPWEGLATLHLCFAIVIPASVIAWHVLGRWPIPMGRLLARVLPGRAGVAWAEVSIDQELVRKWVFGRRVWLGIGCLFHGVLFMTMNIGMFPIIMVWIYVAYFEAKPFLIAGRWLRDKLRKHRLTRALAPRLLDGALSSDEGVLETARQSLRRDPTGPWWLDPWRGLAVVVELARGRGREALVVGDERCRNRGGRIPDAAILLMCGAAVVLVISRGLEANTDAPPKRGTKAVFVGKVRSPDLDGRKQAARARRLRIDRLGDVGHWWAYAGLGLALASHLRRRPPMDLCVDDQPAEATPAEASLGSPQLIGGTLARTLVFGFMVYHCGAVGTTFIPRYSVTEAWRLETQRVFGHWVRGTGTAQRWMMFAPNPPHGNTFMRTVVVDGDGRNYQVGLDHYLDRPRVFLLNDRERKMHRRMLGHGKWYRRHWGQYHCRDWALNNAGRLPQQVQIYRLATAIPKPDELVESGVPSDPRERPVVSDPIALNVCEAEDVTPTMKQRRGWALSEADQQRLGEELERQQSRAEAKRSKWAKRQDFGGTG